MTLCLVKTATLGAAAASAEELTVRVAEAVDGLLSAEAGQAGWRVGAAAAGVALAWDEAAHSSKLLQWVRDSIQ